MRWRCPWRARAGLFAGEKAKVPTLLIVLTLPTVLINGACWGQCDAVYVFFIVMSLCDMKTRKPVRAAAMLAIAFAFKLQTIFFFPIVLLGLIHGEYKPKHALVFALAYLATTVPALIAGRSLGDALGVYVNQSVGQYYDRLTYNAPNLYTFFPMLVFANTQEYTWMRYIAGVNGKVAECVSARRPHAHDAGGDALCLRRAGAHRRDLLADARQRGYAGNDAGYGAVFRDLPAVCDAQNS